MIARRSAIILLVDDDADTRALVGEYLTADGYNTCMAASGEEALTLLEDLQPDLILLDAVMPGLDGFETCRAIKRRPAMAIVPIIFMTGLSDSDHVVEGLSAGGVDYVSKPLSLEALSARIRVHLATAQATRSALTALNRAGAYLLSADAGGAIGWMAPATQQLLDELDWQTVAALRQACVDLVAGLTRGPVTVTTPGSRSLDLTMLEPFGADEVLFRLERSIAGQETNLLQQAFRLTGREADVLLWISRGKSNKDMSEILNISARTVNKHIEQVFIKLGVENRASAAALATRELLVGRF